jgi:hypothetical protein
MDSKEYELAASMTPKILRTDVKLWEGWIYRFSEVGQLDVIRPFIPVSHPKLSPAVYEMVLGQYLQKKVLRAGERGLKRSSKDLAAMNDKASQGNRAVFLELVKKWPCEIYDVRVVVDAIEELLSTLPPLQSQKPSFAVTGSVLTSASEREELLEASVVLNKLAFRWDIALLRGLELGVPTILDLVKPHNLFDTMSTHILDVMRFDGRMVDLGHEKGQGGAEEGFGYQEYMGTGESGVMAISETVRRLRVAGNAQGAQLLVGNVDLVPVAHVVAQMEGTGMGGQNSRFLHIYLDALFRKDPQEGAEYHSRQIELYATYDPGRLLDFLRLSTAYDVKAAFEICEARDLVPEMVFLLGKMGNNRKALALVIERLGDVKRVSRNT